MAVNFAETDDVYVVLNSDACKDICPQNRPNDFKNNIETSTPLDTSYTVALVELTVARGKPISKDMGMMLVNTDLTTTQVMQWPRPLLRAVSYDYTGNKDFSAAFAKPYYLRVNCQKVTSVRVWLQTSKGAPYEFIDDLASVTITLHFKKKT